MLGNPPRVEIQEGYEVLRRHSDTEYGETIRFFFLNVSFRTQLVIEDTFKRVGFVHLETVKSYRDKDQYQVWAPMSSSDLLPF